MKRVGAAIALAILLGIGISRREADQDYGSTLVFRAPASETLPELLASARPADTLRYHDGRRWRDVFWASDEVRVDLRPGADAASIAAGSQILERSEAGVTVALSPTDREGFSKRAEAIRSRAGVRDILPVFYSSESGRGARSASRRMFLTRQVAATLPRHADPIAAAARYGARVIREIPSLPGTHVFEAAEGMDAPELAEALRVNEGATLSLIQFARQPHKISRPPLTPTDPLYPQQWHLKNTAQSGGIAGQDLQVESAWDVTLGAGAVIAMIDDGMQTDHPDLAASYMPVQSYDYFDNDGDPSAVLTSDNHGTAVAGVAGARMNTVGGVGSAPQTGLVAIRLISGGITDSQRAAALGHSDQVIQIKSNSWTYSGDGLLDDDPGVGHLLDLQAIANSAVNGRGGRGTVFVWAAGNNAVTDQFGFPVTDDVNYDAYCTRRQVIVVGAVDDAGLRSWYSEKGAALMVVAPSSGNSIGIITTDRTGTDGYVSGDYTPGSGPDSFGGTSSAAPLTAGVVGLILSANPNLSWRDVQHILIRTARKTDPGGGGWVFNGAAPPRQVSHSYGHGVVHAANAVTLARAFPYAAGETVVSGSGAPGLVIPDMGSAVSHSLSLPSLRVENVEVVLNAAHPYRGDLRIVLTSPSNTQSILAHQRGEDSVADYAGWQFRSTLFWGENASGSWTLSLQDQASLDTGVFTNWELRVYGTPIDVTPPVAGSVRDGAGADIDFQGSTSSISANWSGFSDGESGIAYEWAIGVPGLPESVRPFTSTGYGTSASTTGLSLTPGQTYEVTVRASNFEGLTSTAISDGVTIDSSPPQTPAAPSGSPTANNTGVFTVSWSAVSDVGPAGVASYELQRSDNGGASYTSIFTGSSLAFNENVSQGDYLYQIRAIDGAGNPGAFSPASAPVVVDFTPPNTTIDTGPPNPAGIDSATFTFSSDEAGGFETSLDGAAFTSNGASTTISYGGLIVGSHTFRVRARDAANNVDATPAVFTWTIAAILEDGVAPMLNGFSAAQDLLNWTSSSTGGSVAWAVDGSPASMTGGAFFSGPGSLNYNNGTNFDTPGLANSGIVTSRTVNRAALATARLKFFCNYATDDTGLTTDQRFVRVGDPAFGTVHADVQLSSGLSAAGACGPMGTWHEHVLTLNPAWGNDVRIRFVFDTVTSAGNLGGGWFIDDLEISDLLVSGLQQYISGATAPLPAGGISDGYTFDYRGRVSDASPAGAVRLDVEVQPVGSAFTGAPTASATASGPGTPISLSIVMPAAGGYRWRARTENLLTAELSEWMDFGLNPSAAADFSAGIVPPPAGGGGGGGGCGASGFEFLLPALLLVLIRRRAISQPG